MVADTARVTYDPTRQYRSLIYQQGRVTLEADNNEAEMLSSEALRLETIDIIGPQGTPDNGFAVGSGKGPGGITIGKGIYYLGGWRLRLDTAIDLSEQLIDDNALDLREGRFVVALLLTEQTVGAVEDQALLEVALGGPDSAARSRLMQHFLRIPIDADTCVAAAADVLALLARQGITVDSTLQLISSATLQAGFVSGPASQDPCTPAAAGGYLGADNQMVRVTVTKFDATTSKGSFLWGWNNASLLYRATASDPLTLTLVNTPVDQEHAPQQNQMVEILRTELALGNKNFIAEEQGFVTSVAQAYSFDTQEMALADALPAAYQNNTNPLFVRLWQSQVSFDAGQVTKLDDVSGITVKIAMTALPTQIALRPFWRFTVRPATPQNIYPQRYVDGPQPPDGPRQWLADLAVMEALDDGSKLLEDCRVSFQPLTAQSAGCCGLVLGPDEVAGRGGLQAVVDGLAGSTAVLSLRSGTYHLAAPLVLDKRHNGLTLEGCSDEVILQASAADQTPFRLGLVVLEATNNITLRQLDFKVPAVPVDPAATKASLTTLVGLGVTSARHLTIEQCAFDLSAPSVYAFGAGIMVLGATETVVLRETIFAASKRGAEVAGVIALVDGQTVLSELDRWDISNNQFSNLDIAIFGFAQLGLVRCRGNLVTGCGSGFVFAEANIGSSGRFAYYAVQEAAAGRNVALGQAANAALRPDRLVDQVTKAAAIIAALPQPAAAPVVSDMARKVLTDQFNSSGVAAYKSLVPVQSEADAAGQASTSRVTVDTADFDTLDTISAGVELYEVKLTPALRIEDNEVTLTSNVTTPWVGIGVVLSLDEPGSVMISGNRVAVPDASIMACALLLPAAAVVEGNLLAQLALAPAATQPLPCLMLLTTSPAIMVGSNMISFVELVLPARTSQAATTSWEFLNTVG
jgi:hypothetical protein